VLKPSTGEEMDRGGEQLVRKRKKGGDDSVLTGKKWTGKKQMGGITEKVPKKDIIASSSQE